MLEKTEELWLLVGHLSLEDASGLLPLQQRWWWSVDCKSVNCLSCSKTTSCPSVRLQDRGITQYKGTENGIP